MTNDESGIMLIVLHTMMMTRGLIGSTRKEVMNGSFGMIMNLEEANGFFIGVKDQISAYILFVFVCTCVFVH